MLLFLFIFFFSIIHFKPTNTTFHRRQLCSINTRIISTRVMYEYDDETRIAADWTFRKVLGDRLRRRARVTARQCEMYLSRRQKRYVQFMRSDGKRETPRFDCNRTILTVYCCVVKRFLAHKSAVFNRRTVRLLRIRCKNVFPLLVTQTGFLSLDQNRRY